MTWGVEGWVWRGGGKGTLVTVDRSVDHMTVNLVHSIVPLQL